MWLSKVAEDPGGVLFALFDNNATLRMVEAVTFGHTLSRRLGIMYSNGTNNSVFVESEDVILPLGAPLHLVLVVNQSSGVRTLYSNGITVLELQAGGSTIPSDAVVGARPFSA